MFELFLGKRRKFLEQFGAARDEANNQQNGRPIDFVQIETNAAGFNLVEINVSDAEQTETFCIDNAELQQALSYRSMNKETSHYALLDLIYNNCTSVGIDILQAAAVKDTTVTINGETISPVTLKQVFSTANLQP